jgi:hypothetical protein
MSSIITEVCNRFEDFTAAVRARFSFDRESVQESRSATLLIQTFQELQAEVAARFKQNPDLGNFVSRRFLALHELGNLHSIQAPQVAEATDILESAGFNELVRHKLHFSASDFAEFRRFREMRVAYLTNKGLEYGSPEVGGMPTMSVWPELQAHPISIDTARAWHTQGLTPADMRKIVTEGVKIVESLARGQSLADTVPEHSRRWLVTAGPAWALRLIELSALEQELPTRLNG